MNGCTRPIPGSTGCACLVVIWLAWQLTQFGAEQQQQRKSAPVHRPVAARPVAAAAVEQPQIEAHASVPVAAPAESFAVGTIVKLAPQAGDDPEGYFGGIFAVSREAMGRAARYEAADPWADNLADTQWFAHGGAYELDRNDKLIVVEADDGVYRVHVYSGDWEGKEVWLSGARLRRWED